LRNGALVDGHLMRAQIPEGERKEVQAILQRSDDALLLRQSLCRELFGKVPKANLRRVGTMQYVAVDLNDPEGFLAALEGAELEPEEKAGQGEGQAPGRLGEPGMPLPFKATGSVLEPLWETAGIDALEAAAGRQEQQEAREQGG
jgi:hypothetical protein